MDLIGVSVSNGDLRNETNHSSQNALVQRRARVHKETELDSAVSSKFFGDIADGFESLGDAVGDTFEDIGEGIASVGLTVGSHVGNAAMVVGNSVVDVAESTVNALPAAIRDAANSLGNAVVLRQTDLMRQTCELLVRQEFVYLQLVKQTYSLRSQSYITSFTYYIYNV